MKQISYYLVFFASILVQLLTACSSPSTAPTPMAAGMSNWVEGKVDAGGYELYYICVGEGSPTVILEAGGGGDSSGWELVMLYYRSYTRVCAYDRANLGKSDSASKPRTFDDMTRDLHTLLQKLPIEGPYVLAGHSMGGMLIRLFASQYPEDVVGLVLVDSAHPDMGDRLLATLPSETAGEDKSFKTWRQYATWMSTSEGKASVDAEGVDMRVSNGQVRAVKSLGNLPLAVVSRSPNNPVMVGGFPSLPEEINTALMQQWQDMQTELEGLSSNNIRFTAVRSGHGVPLEEPKLVVEAIRHVVNEYRVNAGIPIPPDAKQTDAASHAPVLTGITERKEWKNGMLVIYEDIYFTDLEGDAITVINNLVSAPSSASISDDVIRASVDEQKQGAVLTSYIRCRNEITVVIEYQVYDAAGNTSEPEAVTFVCPAPKSYVGSLPIVGLVLGLALLGLAIWLLVHYRCSKRVAASLE